MALTDEELEAIEERIIVWRMEDPLRLKQAGIDRGALLVEVKRLRGELAEVRQEADLWKRRALQTGSVDEARGGLPAVAIVDKRAFADVLNDAFQREGFVTLRSVAEQLGVSVTTVKHWLEGKVVPHPNVQPHVIACVRECAVPPKD